VILRLFLLLIFAANINFKTITCLSLLYHGSIIFKK
jgi:hypothetical protein